MLDHMLRGTKDRVLESAVRRLRLALSPTTITAVGLLVGLAGVVLVARQQYAWGLLFWLLNRLLDGLDGTVARLRGQQSDLGGYVDILADFVVYSLLPVALVLGAPSSAGYIALALLLSTFYVNAASWMYLAAILEKRRHGVAARGELTTVTMPDGIIGGTETFLFYCLFLLFPAQLVPLFATLALLVVASTLQRLLWAGRNLA